MDVVVTVPKDFRYFDAPGKVGLEAWLAEGDPPGSEWSGEEWDFMIGHRKPRIQPGERVYIVCEDRLRGYAPLIRVHFYPYPEYPDCGPYGRYSLIRGGGAVAVTLDEPIKGFRGFRYCWWNRKLEKSI